MEATAQRWWIRSRWLGVVALWGWAWAVAAVPWLPDWPIAPLLGVLATSVVSQLGLVAMSSRVLPNWVVASVLVMDEALIGWMLAYSGGVLNPFTLLTALPVVQAALVLPGSWVAVLMGVVSVGVFILGWLSPEGALAQHRDAQVLYQRALTVAYLLVGPVVVAAVSNARAAQAKAHAAQVTAQQQSARDERLRALGTLAAGAAHELGSPLTNIVLLADTLPEASRVAIRDEVDRCTELLAQLVEDAGAPRGEMPLSIELHDLLEDAVEPLPSATRVDLEGSCEVVSVPIRLVSSVIRRLVGNAMDASDPSQRVVLRGRVDGPNVVIEVEDQGAGMSEAVRAQALDPFFSTKGPGRGMGLGLTFVQTAVEQAGGVFALRSRLGEGTVARVEWPLEAR